jgi:predicted transcriptional regulator YdeE
MKGFLLSLFIHPVEGTQPRIVDLEHPILILGLSTQTNTRTIARDVPGLGRRFERYKQEHGLPNRKEPWGFAAVSYGYDEVTGAFTYLMGDVVTSLDQVPEGLVGFEIPAGTYAVFPVRPKNKLGWGLGIPAVKGYAYRGWLPGSGYEAAGGPVDDFEYHDERSVRKRNPEIDLYIAVRKKD